MSRKSMRIWHYWNGSYVRLKLEPGKRVCLSTGGRTDEGWEARHDALELDEDGSILTLETFSEGQDCDGYLSHSETFVMDGTFKDEIERPFPVPGMARGITISDVITVPNWVRQRGEVYDHNAQMAGY